LAQGGDDRHPAADARLDPESDAALPRQGEQARAVQGDRDLVGGGDRATGPRAAAIRSAAGCSPPRTSTTGPSPARATAGSVVRQVRGQQRLARPRCVAHEGMSDGPLRARRIAGAGNAAADHAEAEEGEFVQGG
jgi:hypothetical protein